MWIKKRSDGKETYLRHTEAQRASRSTTQQRQMYCIRFVRVIVLSKTCATGNWTQAIWSKGGCFQLWYCVMGTFDWKGSQITDSILFRQFDEFKVIPWFSDLYVWRLNFWVISATLWIFNSITSSSGGSATGVLFLVSLCGLKPK